MDDIACLILCRMTLHALVTTSTPYALNFYPQFLRQFLATHLVRRFACNTRVIADASSSPPVFRIKIAVTKT